MREVEEECGINIDKFLTSTACLGLVDIAAVDHHARRVTRIMTPLFVCNGVLKGITPGTLMANIREWPPSPLFPDASIGIAYVKEHLKAVGRILPQWLNDGGIIYFSMKPRMGLLMGPPDWLKG